MTTVPNKFDLAGLMGRDGTNGNIRSAIFKQMQEMQLIDDENLIKIFPAPNMNVVEGSTIKGVGYLVKSTMQASKIMKTTDLCSGVSAYKILKLGSECSESNIPNFFRNKIKDMNLRDCSVNLPKGYYDSEFELKLECHLGATNCSVGIYKNTTIEGNNWILIIRSYDTLASKKLYDYIHEYNDEGFLPNIGSVFVSKEYEFATKLGNYNRDLLAFEISNACKFKMSEYYTSNFRESKFRLCKSMCINNYNYLVSFETASYVYYDHCYCTKDATRGILFGNSRQSGYTLMLGDPDKTGGLNWFSKTSCHVFPMGYPKKMSRHEIPKGILNNTSYNPSKVSYGGIMGCNYKILPEIYDNCRTNRQWLGVFKTLGCEIITEDLPYYSEHCYTSACDPCSIPIKEAVNLCPSDCDNFIYPMDNHFVEHELFPGLNKLRKINPKMGLTNLLKGEPHRGFVRLDKHHVGSIIDANCC